MDTINTFFADLADKIPFATDFFAHNLKAGSFEINTLFLLLVAAVIVIIAAVVIIVCSCKAAKANKKAKQTEQTADATEAPVQNAEAAEQEATADASVIADDAEPATAVAEQEAPAEEPAEQEKAVEAEEEEAQAATKEEIAEPAKEKAAESQEEPAVAADEAKPVNAPVTTKEDTIVKKEAKAAPQKEEKAKKTLVGTFEVSLCIDGYRFCLYASNKQLMYESVGFTSSDGAMKGIETFRKTLQETPYVITHDKYGHYRYVFNKRYQGENYSAAAQAQSAAESVKRWAENAKVILRNPKPEEKEAYKKALDTLRTKDDVDWDEVAAVEAKERKMGKFTVEEDGNQDEVIGYRFYLIANNAQILYTSAIYTTAAGALKAIDTFKRAVYIGNFYVDEDKFGRFRYILRANASTTYVGESYATRASAESSIESVKKFVKCATIVPFKKDAE